MSTSEADIRALAADAWEKLENLRMMGMANTPTEPEERKAAFVAYAVAQAQSSAAKAKLDNAIIEGIANG